MGQSRLQVRPISLLTSFVIIYGISPTISRLVSSTISTYGFLAILLLTIMIVAMGNMEIFVNVYTASALPLIGYCILNFFVKTDSVILWGYQSLLFIIPIIFGVYLLYYSSNDMEYCGKVIIIVLVVTLITTIVGCVQYPNAARYLATVSNANDDMNVLLEWHNVGGFTFVYSVVLLYPLVIYSYKQKKIPLVVSIIMSIAVISLTITTEYTIAFLLVLVTTLLYLVKRELPMRGVFILGALIVALILIFGEQTSFLLKSLSGLLNSEQMQARLMAISGGASSLESLDDNRLELYRNAFQLFLQHPIVGTMFGDKSGSGGHSQILITLGQHGIIGGCVMFFMYHKIYRLFYKPFVDMPGFGFYFWIFIEALILSFLNTGFFIPVLTLYAPVLFCLIGGVNSALREY